jgi:hypothetical protein
MTAAASIEDVIRIRHESIRLAPGIPSVDGPEDYRTRPKDDLVQFEL